MSDKTNGGPAFPILGKRWHPSDGFHDVEHVGMTLRDYFAAKAMQGYCAREGSIECEMGDIAADSYRLAGRMLAERSAS